jgi:uncharacterized protein YbjT (DUF2867 family)
MLNHTVYIVTNGKLVQLHHFDSKALVEEYIRSQNIPASFVLPAYFMSNVPSSIQPSPSGNSLSITWPFHPHTAIPMLDVTQDFGKFVAGCLLHPTSTMGKHTLAASGWFSPLDICAAVQAVTSTKTTFHEVPSETYAGHPEMMENMLVIRDYEYYGPGAKTGVQDSHALLRGESFSTFLSFFRDLEES